MEQSAEWKMDGVAESSPTEVRRLQIVREFIRLNMNLNISARHASESVADESVAKFCVVLVAIANHHVVQNLHVLAKY
eukprot:scaffold70686_cov32-Prasinocladus_malaysianus.AAC.1